MKKILAITFTWLVILAPMGFAGAICDAVDSPQYVKATGAKLARGIGNVVVSWVELFRQPVQAENKLEGVGLGLVYTTGRAIAGALETATAIIPTVEIPQLDPSCPTDVLKT